MGGLQAISEDTEQKKLMSDVKHGSDVVTGKPLYLNSAIHI